MIENQYEDIQDFFTKTESEQQLIITEVFSEYLTLCQMRKLRLSSIYDELDDLIQNMTDKENYEGAYVFGEVKKSIISSVDYQKKIR